MRQFLQYQLPACWFLYQTPPDSASLLTEHGQPLVTFINKHPSVLELGYKLTNNRNTHTYVSDSQREPKAKPHS